MADYGINIGVNVQSAQLGKLTQQLKELRKIEQDLIRIQESGVSTQKKVADARRAAKDEINKNKKAALDAAKSFTEFTGVISKGSSALKEQGAQFRAYRQNVKFGKAEWVTFTQAITKTDFSATISSLKRFNTEAETIAKTFALMGKAGAGGPAFGAFSSIESLLAFKPANTTNALQAYNDVLAQVRNQVNIASNDYKLLAQRIAEVNQQMSRAIVPTANQYGAPIGPERAPSRFSQFFGRQTRQQRVSGAISSGLIGGGFPLLFGQAGPGAIGGLAGGLAGGALGGGFGFGLSVIGTAIGEAIQKNIEFNKSLKTLNVTFGSAGNGAKLFASDIDSIQKSLKGTREEALEAAQAFSFFGDTRLTTQFAKVFGKDAALLQKGLAVRDPESLRDAVESVSEVNQKLGEELAQNVLNLSVEEARLKVIEAMVRAKKGTAAPTERVQIGERKTRRGTRKIFGERAILGAGDVPEAVGAADRLAALLEQISPTDTPAKADPTIALRQRLEAARGQIEAETELLELQGRQSDVARIIYRENMAIVKAQAAGVAERKKLTDIEDILLSQQIEASKIKAANLKFERETSELAERILESTKDLARPLQDQIDQIKDKAAFEREYGELIRSGVVPAVAQQTVEINKQVKEIQRLTEKQLVEIDLQIEKLRLLVAAVAGTEAEVAMQERLNEALERRNEIERKGRQAQDAARDAQKTDKDRLQDAIDLIQGQINNLMDPVQQVIGLAQTLGNAFAESFKGIINGSMTAREALANLFQRTADYFLDMAARMIAAQIQMQILKIGLSFLGGGGAGAGAGTTDISGFSAYNDSTGLTLASFGGGMASGGRVSGGTSYLVGERGPELFTPGASGMITPNHELGGSGVQVGSINITVENTGEQLSPAAQKQIANQVQGIVMSTLVNERRSGGVLR
jgi:hypothetical protein